MSNEKAYELGRVVYLEWGRQTSDDSNEIWHRLDPVVRNIWIAVGMAAYDYLMEDEK